jgi:gentisate 1,2-dioxygenase
MTETQASKADALAALAADAEALHLIEFWKQRMDIELPEPRDLVKPFLWHWRDIEPRLRRAAQIVPVEDCERRALLFANPGLGGRPFMSTTLLGAYSLYNAGEVAPVHRHTPCASRFVLEGQGGYTVVEGEKCRLERGDLVITPNGTWHDHGNEGPDELIWVDILDVPLVEGLNATMFEFDYAEADPQSNSGEPVPTQYQTVSTPDDHSNRLYAAGGMKPLFVDHRRGLGNHSPKFVYRWRDMRQALDRMREYDGSPDDGIIVEYCDPVTGASVMPSMSFRSQMLRPGEHTRSHRHMSSTIYVVLEGEGWTEVDGARLDWGRNDVFVVPTWKWHRHANARTDGDAVLYSVTDEPVMRMLGLDREQVRTADGAILPAAA